MKKEGSHPQWRRSPAELNERVVKVDDMNKVKKKLRESERLRAESCLLGSRCSGSQQLSVHFDSQRKVAIIIPWSLNTPVISHQLCINTAAEGLPVKEILRRLN